MSNIQSNHKTEVSDEEREFNRAVMLCRLKAGFNRPWKIAVIISCLLAVTIAVICNLSRLATNPEAIFSLHAIKTLAMDVLIGLFGLLVLYGLISVLGTPLHAGSQKAIKRLFRKSVYYPVLVSIRPSKDKGIQIWEFENFGTHTNKWREEEDNLSAILKKPIVSIEEGKHAGRTLLYVAQRKRPHSETLHWKE